MLLRIIGYIVLNVIAEVGKCLSENLFLHYYLAEAARIYSLLVRQLYGIVITKEIGPVIDRCLHNQLFLTVFNTTNWI